MWKIDELIDVTALLITASNNGVDKLYVVTAYSHLHFSPSNPPLILSLLFSQFLSRW